MCRSRAVGRMCDITQGRPGSTVGGVSGVELGYQDSDIAFDGSDCGAVAEPA